MIQTIFSQAEILQSVKPAAPAWESGDDFGMALLILIFLAGLVSWIHKNDPNSKNE